MIKMDYSTIISALGIVSVLIYSLVQIFNFYDIKTETYAIYFTFYLFLFMCAILFPRYYNQ